MAQDTSTDKTKLYALSATVMAEFAPLLLIPTVGCIIMIGILIGILVYYPVTGE